MLATVFEILFAAALLWGVWHREKLIAFERKIADACVLAVAALPVIFTIIKTAVKITMRAARFAIKETIILIQKGDFDVGE